MKEKTTQAIVELVNHIQEQDYHVSSIEANEYLRGAGFDTDDVMGTEVELTVMIPGDEEDDDNQYRIK